MELRIGKMTSREIAEWFGISYSSYRRSKQKKEELLEKLLFYCSYKSIYGGIIVKEIFVSEYNKNLNTDASKEYLIQVKEANSNLCTIAGMTRKLRIEYPDTWGKLSESAVIKSLRNAGIALFGETNLPLYREQEEKHSGPCGYREYCWAIKVNDFNKYRFLTEEENKIFDDLLQSYNISSKDIALKEQVEKEYKRQLVKREITIEEYDRKTSNIELFPQLLSKFKKETGLVLVHATRHEILESAF